MRCSASSARACVDLAHGVQGVDLPADHPADLQVEAVGTKIDGGEDLRAGHGGPAYTLWKALQISMLRAFAVL
jgi:hypothetical protein